MLVSVLNALHILTELMLTIILRGKCYYYFHFILKKKKETGTERLSNSPIVTRLVSGGIRIFTWTVRLHTASLK